MAKDVKDKLVTVEGLGVTLGKDASGNDVESTYAKKDFSSMPIAPTPFNGNELIPMSYGGDNYATSVNELLSAAGGGSGTTQGALVNYVKNCGTISSLPQTISDSNITSDMVVLEAVLGTPSAQTGDWSVSTANGSVTISGSITGSTTLMLYFGVGMTTAPSLMTNLASTSTDNILKATPRPGVMGTLGLANGGTGKSASSEADLRSKLGITPTNIGAVNKSGDTMTGDLTVAHSGDTYVVAKNTSTGAAVYLDSEPYGQHGIWSDGYYDGSDFVSDGKFMITRKNNGEVVVRGKLMDVGDTSKTIGIRYWGDTVNPTGLTWLPMYQADGNSNCNLVPVHKDALIASLIRRVRVSKITTINAGSYVKFCNYSDILPSGSQSPDNIISANIYAGTFSSALTIEMYNDGIYVYSSHAVTNQSIWIVFVYITSTIQSDSDINLQ